MISRRCLALVSALLSAAHGGCLYLEPVNQRPGIEIVRVTQGPILRGSQVQLDALVSDPDHHEVIVTWRAYACGLVLTDCQGIPADRLPSAGSDAFSFVVPFRTDSGQRVERIRVTLEARDSRGAEARPSQELLLDVRDEPGVLREERVSAKRVVGVPVQVCVRHEDLDDPPLGNELTWTLRDPSGTPVTPLEVTSTVEPRAALHCLTFVAADGQVGDWSFGARVTTPELVEYGPRTLEVRPDDHPALMQSSPTPGLLLLDQVRRFAVLQVDDARDPYPGGSPPTFGTARFAWSIKAPSLGGARLPLAGVSGNSVELDPLSFAVGEQVELRVEVSDRRGLWPTCSDSAATCSAANDGRLQRQTWLLEVR